MLRLTKEPNDKFVHETRLVDWVSLDSGKEVSRIPQPHIYEYSLITGFQINHKGYHSVVNLRARVLDENQHIYRSIYGRIIAEILEQFPCFDSYDFANEDRYYHWLCLVEKGKLYCVYYEDGQDAITVTEDADKIEATVWREMLRLGWVKNMGVQAITGFLGALYK